VQPLLVIFAHHAPGGVEDSHHQRPLRGASGAGTADALILAATGVGYGIGIDHGSHRETPAAAHQVLGLLMEVCALCKRRPANAGMHRLVVERNGSRHEVRAYVCGECLWLLKRAGEHGHRFWETGGHWRLPAP
jgi:hypothetical protein